MTRRAKGEGTIYFDTTRHRWIGQADAGLNPLTGKRRRVKVTGDSKSDVSKRLKERIEELDSLSTGPETIGAVADKWLSRAAPKTKSPTTMKMVVSLVDCHIRPVFGDVELSAVTVDDIEAFLDARVDTLSRSTLKKLRSILNQIYVFAVRRGYCLRNPAAYVELPRDATQTRQPRTLTEAETRRLIAVSSDHRLAAWPVVAVRMGLRPGELAGLCWDAVDWDAGTVTIFRSLTRDGRLKDTKTGNSRTLALSPDALDSLRIHRKISSEEAELMGDRWPDEWSDLVFRSESGTPLNDSNLRRLLSRWATEAGVTGSVVPYDLRHTALTRLRERGARKDDLADFAGHGDTRMLDSFYIHRNELVSTVATLWDS